MNTLRFQADCQIQAADGKLPSVSILAYTGGTMRLPGLGQTVVDLAGMQMAQIPLLADHENSLSGIAGTGMPHIDGGSLRVTGTLASGTAAADQILALHKSGITLQASIGAEIESQKFVDGGQSITANGRTIAAPVGGMTYVTKSTLREVSFVAAGADRQTSVSIAAALERNRQMQQADFETWADQMGVDRSLMTGQQLAELHANYQGRTQTFGSDHAAVATFIAASAGDPVQEEQRRLQQIERATAGDWGEQGEQVHTLKAKAVGGELSVDDLISELRAVRIAKLEAQIPMAHVQFSRRPACDSKVLEAALTMTGGISADKLYDEQTLEAADRFKGLGLQQLLLYAAAANGFDCRPGTTITSGNLRSVLQFAFTPQIRAAGASTISIPDVVSNVAEKYLFDGFNSVDQTILRISAVRPVTNFKQITTVSLLGGLTFEQIGSDGEIKHGTLSDLTYTNQAATYAKMLTITRTDIINDDLGALTVAPRKLGRGAMLKLNDIGWAMFLNNSSFFTSGHTNVSTGGGSALGDAGLAAAEKVFLNQTDPDGNPLGVMPSILLVPPTLKATGRKLLTSQFMIAGSTTDTQPSGNIWQGVYTLESSPYMEISTYSGYSTAAWYLLAPPSALPVLEIAALGGRVEPTVESAQADFETLGISMRGYADVGVNLQEYRGGVRSAGS